MKKISLSLAFVLLLAACAANQPSSGQIITESGKYFELSAPNMGAFELCFESGSDTKFCFADQEKSKEEFGVSDKEIFKDKRFEDPKFSCTLEGEATVKIRYLLPNEPGYNGGPEGFPLVELKEITSKSPYSIKCLNTYNSKEFNISFQYPSTWKVVEQEKSGHAVNFVPGPNENIFFDFQAKSFDEYEKDHGKAETGGIGGLTIEETTMANYPAKKYTEYGVELAGIRYIIEKNGKFLMFSTESGLAEDQKTGVEEIINSLGNQNLEKNLN